MKNIFPNVPSLFDAWWGGSQWRHGSALLRLAAPYAGGLIMLSFFLAILRWPVWWWAWMAGALIAIFFLVNQAATPLSIKAGTRPRFAIPAMLIMGGAGLFMVADNEIARIAVVVMLVFSIMVALRMIIQSKNMGTSNQSSYTTTMIFASSVAIFSMSVGASTLVTLINFPSWGAVGIIFLSCLATIRQLIWQPAASGIQTISWYWVISLVCAEMFAVTLLLPVPIVTGSALVWLTYCLLAEFYRKRLLNSMTYASRFIASAVYAAACIGILVTARWP